MAAVMVVLRISVLLICLFKCTFAVHGQFTERQKIENKFKFRNASFDDRIHGIVTSGEGISYVFHYDFHCNQPWAVYVCVRSTDAKDHTPLFVVVRESLHINSWSVPMQFDVKSFKYTEICHTLCPLANYFKCGFEEGPQEIYIDFSTSSNSNVSFELLVSNFTSFIVGTYEETTLHLTPTEPKVLEYIMPEGVNSVLIEASSPTDSCMVLAIQDIHCPFYDSERTVEYKGFYQTMTLQSGITVTERYFKEREVYIILILKPDDSECQKEEYIDEVYYSGGVYPQRKKNVTVKIKPSLSDTDFNAAVGGTFGIYIAFCVVSFIICCCFKQQWKTNPANQDPANQDPANQDPANQDPANQGPANREIELKSITVERRIDPQNRITKAGNDALPDPEQPLLHVVDLVHRNQQYVSGRANLYTWNLLAIAIFYGLPVVQLVYINQKIVYLTGNQDLCYYNFLCSHKLWGLSDFNHILSNIGYVMLGGLFFLLTWRRKNLVRMASSRERIPILEPKGIPHHFGLFYAMGVALMMEGVMSSSYHVCPNQANFQFDTTFMYVITTLCMLKLYHSRHPDTTTESHQTWMILAVVLIIGVIGELNNHIVLWVLFTIIHTIAVIIATAKIYYVGRWKLDKHVLERIRHSFASFRTSQNFQPMHPMRCIILSSVVVLNFAWDLYGLIKQPEDFCTFLLIIFIINLSLYVIYYTTMKKNFGETIGWIPIMYMILSLLWIPALYFLCTPNVSWEMTPALSREKNKHCFILNFYDGHDLWHFLSSFALFFSYMVLFTLDDDLANEPQSSITVF